MRKAHASNGSTPAPRRAPPKLSPRVSPLLSTRRRAPLLLPPRARRQQEAARNIMNRGIHEKSPVGCGNSVEKRSLTDYRRSSARGRNTA